MFFSLYVFEEEMQSSSSTENMKETSRCTNFPEARYDIDPTRFPDSAESARGERKIKKKEKLGAEQSLDFKTIQGFIRGLELFSLLTSVS